MSRYTLRDAHGGVICLAFNGRKCVLAREFSGFAMIGIVVIDVLC